MIIYFAFVYDTVIFEPKLLNSSVWSENDCDLICHGILSHNDKTQSRKKLGNGCILPYSENECKISRRKECHILIISYVLKIIGNIEYMYSR